MIYGLSVLQMFVLPANIMQVANEPEELTLKRMLRLSGQTAGVEIAIKWIFTAFVLIPFMLILTLVGKFAFLQNVTFGVLFLLLLLLSI